MEEGKRLSRYFTIQEQVNDVLSMIGDNPNLKEDKERLIQFSKKSIKTRMQLQGLLNKTIGLMLINVNDVEDREAVLNVMTYCKERGYNTDNFEDEYKDKDLGNEPRFAEGAT